MCLHVRGSHKKITVKCVSAKVFYATHEIFMLRDTLGTRARTVNSTSIIFGVFILIKTQEVFGLAPN